MKKLIEKMEQNPIDTLAILAVLSGVAMALDIADKWAKLF